MSKQSKNNNPLFIVTAIALLAGGSLILAIKYLGTPTTPSPTPCLNQNCAKAKDKGEYIYISVQPNTPELALLTDDLLYSMSRQAKGDQIFDLDLAKGDQTESFYKGKFDRQDLKSIRAFFDSDPKTVEIEPTKSSDLALVASVNRTVGLAIANAEDRQFRAVIVTPGTSDPDTIASILQICQRLAESGKAQNVRIYLVGLAPAHRLNTMSAFHPLAANTSSATASHSEWKKLLSKL